MKVIVNGLDVSGRVDLTTLTPLDSDISQIVVASFVVEDQARTLTTTQVPKLYHEVLIGDDATGTGAFQTNAFGAGFQTLGVSLLLFGGFINTLTDIQMHPVGRAWRLDCQGYGVRTIQTATGSLNKSAIIDTDRNFVIAIFRDALKAQAFGGTTIDDAIVTANEPNWPGVQFTSFLSGIDWSYMNPDNAMGNLLKYVPNVYWSIGPDKILTYGLVRTLAAFSVSTSPNGTSLVGMENYVEERVVSDHRNKMRRGGAGASEVTAIDEVSWSMYGRILDDPYKNDTTVPAADLTRRAYAELRARRTKRRASFRVNDKGLKAGTLIDVVNARIGSGTRPAVLCVMDTLIARSTSGAIAGERGRFLVTKVKTVPLGNRNYAYDVEVGDVQTEFPIQLPAAV